MDEAAFALALESKSFGDAKGPSITLPANRVAEILKSLPGPFKFTNAIIDGNLDLQEVEVIGKARFRDCSFADIHLERSTVRGSWFFTRCTVKRFEAHHAHFSDLRFSGGTIQTFTAASCSFDKTCSIKRVTAGVVSLPAAQVAANLRVTTSKTGKVNLQRASVHGLCDLSKLRADELDVDGLSAHRLDAAGLVAYKASFNRTLVKDALDLRGIQIAGTVDLRSAEIGDDIYLDGCHVRNLDLSGTTSGDALFLEDGCTIDEKLTITEGRFGYFQCSARVGGVVDISDVSFSGVHLNAARFVSQFRFRRNTVSGTMRISAKGKDKTTVGGAFSFRGTRIGGQLVVSGLDVARKLALASVTATDIRCSDLRIGASIDLTALTASQVTLESVTVQEEILADAICVTTVDIKHVKCRSFYARSARVTGSFRFDDFDAERFVSTHASYGGQLSFSSTRISAEIDLTRATVGDLRFEEKLTADEADGAFVFPNHTVLRECEYSSLNVNWCRLVNALEGDADYDATAYRALESYVRTLGRLDWADEIYLRSKRHGTSQLPGWSQRNAQYVLDWVSGYGARPSRLLRAAVFLSGGVWLTILVWKCTDAPYLCTDLVPARAFLDLSGITIDVVLRGEKSDVFGGAATVSRTPTIVADTILVLRYVIVALLGVWAAYITGLVRYVGGGRS